MRRIRSAKGGCVANQRDWVVPLTSSMCCTSGCRLCDGALTCTCWPATLRSTPPSPSLLRVNCTARASARNSRWRDTAAFSARPASQPREPAATMATPGRARKERWPCSSASHMLRPRLKIISSPNTMPASRMFRSGIAFTQMAELVGHQALQFIAAQAVERTPGDGHHGIILVPTGGKGVDAVHPGEHHGLGRLHAGGNGQFADDVAQLALRLAAGGPGLARTDPACQFFTAAMQRGSLQPPA